ncbi:MAG: mechanosensitive ion channel domain-containing protein [Pseudomonadota bacterium]
MENNVVENLDQWLSVEQIGALLTGALGHLQVWLSGPAFYAQIGLIIGAFLIAGFMARIARRFLAPDDQSGRWPQLRERLGPLWFWLFALPLLSAGVRISETQFGEAVLLQLVESLTFIRLMALTNRQFASSALARRFIAWVLLPIAVLYIFGLLAPVTSWLETVRFTSGNLSLSLYTVLRVLIFGTILFWLGRKSNDTGKQYIRQQEDLDVATREVFAKLFEIGLFVVIFILLLQVMGINLTTLAVFGGALGVGLGFGLQAIASNFISGVILLLDRSLTVGDYVELEDGKAGVIRALTMRSAILKTFDGKDVVVPNEKFVTDSFVNWTHDDIRQRYAIEFQVAYSTDLEPLLDTLKEVVAGHPQVLSGEDIPIEQQPDAEISGFGDSGVDILIEYWMEGIDDGRNRVDADLNMLIWKALKASNVEIPFPQREVRIIGGGLPTA